MYLKTDNLGHHEIVDGELSASEKSLPPEYQDAYAHGHLLANALTTHDLKSSKTEKEWLNTHGWSVQMPDPKVPFKAIILTSSNLPKKIRVNVLDEVGHQRRQLPDREEWRRVSSRQTSLPWLALG